MSEKNIITCPNCETVLEVPPAPIEHEYKYRTDVENITKDNLHEFAPVPRRLIPRRPVVCECGTISIQDQNHLWEVTVTKDELFEQYKGLLNENARVNL